MGNLTRALPDPRIKADPVLHQKHIKIEISEKMAQLQGLEVAISRLHSEELPRLEISKALVTKDIESLQQELETLIGMNVNAEIIDNK